MTENEKDVALRERIAEKMMNMVAEDLDIDYEWEEMDGLTREEWLERADTIIAAVHE